MRPSLSDRDVNVMFSLSLLHPSARCLAESIDLPLYGRLFLRHARAAVAFLPNFPHANHNCGLFSGAEFANFGVKRI